MAFSASTSRRAPTSHGGPPKTSMPSRTHSTHGHANAWDGELPPRYSKKRYSHNKILVLR